MLDSLRNLFRAQGQPGKPQGGAGARPASDHAAPPRHDDENHSDPRWSINGGPYFGYAIQEAAEINPFKSLLSEDWDRSGETLDYPGDKNLMTIGPMGSGKSRGLLVPNLIRLTGWSLVVIDPKGNLAAQTASYRRAHGSKIVTLDPFGVIEANNPGLTKAKPYLASETFNPFALLDPASREFVDDATRLAAEIVVDDPSGKAEKIWSNSARDLVAGLLMAMKLDERDGGPPATLQTLRRYIGYAPGRLGRLLHKQQRPDGTWTEPGFIDRYEKEVPGIASKLEQFSSVSGENKTLQGVLAETKHQTSWMDSPIVGEVMQTSSVSFDRIKDEPTTVYVMLPPDRIDQFGAWTRLIVYSIMKAVMKSLRWQVPTLFMLDEFYSLGPVDSIEKNAHLVREYGGKIWYVLQGIGQLQANYPSRWKNLTNNCGIIQTFRTSEEETKDFISKEAGQRDYWTITANSGTSVNNSQGGSGTGSNTGENITVTSGPAIEQSEVARIPHRCGVVVNDGEIFRAYFPDPSEVAAWGDVLREAKGEPAPSRQGPPSAPARDGIKMQCPSCKQVMNVNMGAPRQVRVTCPHCKHQFTFNPVRR